MVEVEVVVVVVVGVEVGVEVVVEVGVVVVVEVGVEVGVEVVVVVEVGVEVGVEVVVVVGVEVVFEFNVNNKEIKMTKTKTITVSEETYEAIKDQLADNDFELSCFDDMIGGKFFFRTVTYHLVGKVEKRVGNFLHLKNASWVADSGRFMNAIKEGELNEVEPVGDAFVNLDTVTDFFPWNHSLPTEQK